MNTTINLSGSATFELTTALLVYTKNTPQPDGHTYDWQSQANPPPVETAVTIHPVTGGATGPVIGPGRPITLAGVDALARATGRHLPAAWLPPTVLSIAFGSLVWWCPASRRRIWFKPNSSEKVLLALNGKFVHHPPLLFVAGPRRLAVHALAANERPGPTTRVCRAPYWNLSEAGTMCIGSANLPTQLSASLLPVFEAAFFQSAFTHSNQNRVSAHPGGHARMWRALAKATAPAASYWERVLLPTAHTVQQLITAPETTA